MRKNEPDATLRIIGPIPFYDASGNLATGLTFNGAGESAIIWPDSISGGNPNGVFADTTADPVEALGTGQYWVTLTQAETNHTGPGLVRLRKAGYADHFERVPIDNQDATATGVLVLAAIAELAGMNHKNAVVDKYVYNARRFATSFRVRVFADAAAAAAATIDAADNADGEIARYVGTSTDDATHPIISMTYRKVL